MFRQGVERPSCGQPHTIWRVLLLRNKQRILSCRQRKSPSRFPRRGQISYVLSNLELVAGANAELPLIGQVGGEVARQDQSARRGRGDKCEVREVCIGQTRLNRVVVEGVINIRCDRIRLGFNSGAEIGRPEALQVATLIVVSIALALGLDADFRDPAHVVTKVGLVKHIDIQGMGWRKLKLVARFINVAGAGCDYGACWWRCRRIDNRLRDAVQRICHDWCAVS